MKAVNVGDKACIVELPSQVTHSDDSPVIDACAQANAGDTSHIILDFGAVQRINGLGISMLVKLAARASRKGQHLMAFDVSESHRDVLKATGLDQAVAIFGRATDALSAAGLSPEQWQRADHPSTLEARDVACWATLRERLKASGMPKEAVSLNVEGRQALGPIHGFGPLWHKIYRVRLDTTATPVEIMKTLKENFPSFQPPQNRFYPSEMGIKPGEVVLINASTPAGPLHTGVVILYADDESFTLMTPQGHPLSGCVTFTSYRDNGHTIAEVQGLARSSDPIYELGFRIAGSKTQEDIWKHVLASLATHLGAETPVEMEKICVDPRLQWARAKNAWYNAQIRTMIYTVMGPLRWLGRAVRR
jgi:anti-anti-sigma factor